MTAALLAGFLAAAAVPASGPVLTLGPDPRPDPGPESVHLSSDGRAVTVTWPGGKSRTLDPATKKDVPAPADPPGPDLVARSPGLFELVDAGGKKLAAVFDPDFTLEPKPGYATPAGRWELADDGRHLVLTTEDRLSVWRVADGKRVLALKLGQFDRWAVRGDALFRFGTADGTGGRGGVMARRDLRTGRELPKLALPGGVVNWTPAQGGRVALLPCEEGIVRVDLDAMAVLPTVPFACDVQDGVAVSPDGGSVLVARRLGVNEVVCADYPGGRVRWRADLGLGDGPYVRDLVFASDNKRVLVVASHPGALVTLDRATGKVLDRDWFGPPPKLAREEVVFAGFAADSTLVSVAASGRVERRDVRTGAVADTQLPGGAWVAGDMLPSGKLLVVLARTTGADPGRRLHFLDLSGPGFRWASTPEFAGDAKGFEVTPGGRLLVVAQFGLQGAALAGVYDLATGERRHLVPRPPEGHEVDPETGKVRKTESCRAPKVVTPDGRYELDTAHDVFWVTDRLSDRQAVSVRVTGYTAGGVVVRPAAHLTAVGLDSDRTAVYDTRTWTVVRWIPAGDRIDVSPDGRFLSAHYAPLGVTSVWYLADAPRPKPPTTFPPARRRAAWKTLHDRYNAAEKLGPALWFLQHDPQTVPTLARTVKPVPHTPPERVAEWVAGLGAADPAVRADSYARLVKLGTAARARVAPVAKDADGAAPEQARLAASVLRATEKPSDAEWAGVRAVELLERVATPAARDLLAEYAAGDPAARLTVEAKAARERLGSSEPRP